MDFITNKEKMRDFFEMTKETFFSTYPESEEEYEATIRRLDHMPDKEQLHLQLQCYRTKIRKENREQLIREIINLFKGHNCKNITEQENTAFADQINHILKNWNI